jgi:hypothetical protein
MGDLGVTFDAWVTATPAISAATPPGFTAGAQGNVDTDALLDQWTMDDVRNLQNYANDVIQ